MTDKPDSKRTDRADASGARTDVAGASSERTNLTAASSELAAEPPPLFDADELEWALREAGPMRPADVYAAERQRKAAENGPGTSLT